MANKTLDQFTPATAKPDLFSLIFARDADLSTPMSRNFELLLLAETLKDATCVESMAVSDPTALSPSKGETWVVLPTGAGAWAGQDNSLAIYDGSAWDFSSPLEGWTVFDQNLNTWFYYTGSAWAQITASQILLDNTTNGLTATTLQGAFDEIGTAYGILRTQSSDSATLGSIGTTAQTLPFAAAPYGKGVTSDAANNRITVSRAGDYKINFVINFSTVAVGDAGLYGCIVQVNGADSSIECDRQMSGSSDTGSASATGILTLAASDIVTVSISSDDGGNGDDINILNSSLYVQMLMAT